MVIVVRQKKSDILIGILYPQILMDVDEIQDGFYLEEDVENLDHQDKLENVKFWVALIIGSWYLVGFSKGLK